jgi:hypothetical protein
MANSFYTDRAVGVFPDEGGQELLVPIPYGQVRVCTSPTSGSPCINPADGFVFDLAGNPATVVGGNFGQFTTDVVGRFNFGCLPGNYEVQVAASGSNTPQLSYNITCPSTEGVADVVQLNPQGGALQTINGPLTITGNVSGGVGNDPSGGALNVQKAASPSAIYMGRFVDQFGTNNSQALGVNVEQMLNPSAGPVGYFNAAYTGELVVPLANSQTFTSVQSAADFAFVHFGSGNFTVGVGIGATGEGWNAGPATMLELNGLAGGCHNGSVTAGVPVQTPTNNGSVTNCRGIIGSVSNSSSGIITNAVTLYASGATNTGSGSITNAYALFLGDVTSAANNWSIFSGAGKVHFGGPVDAATTLTAIGGAGTGAAAFGTSSLLTNDVVSIAGSTSTTGTSQNGLQIFATLGGTTESDGINVRADVPSSTTHALNIGIHIVAPFINAGGVITQWQGLAIEPGPVATTKFAINQKGSADINQFAGVLRPAVTSTTDLGTSGQSWNNVFLTGIRTATNCNSAASPAVCGSAAAGSVVIPTGTTSSTLQVNTTAVTANSQIIFYPDDSLGTRLGVTCNSTLATLVGGSFISARAAGASFTITFNGTILTNGVCGTYTIVN